MAQVVAHDIFNKRNMAIEVKSRGIAVYFPAQASPESVAATCEYGLSMAKHVATQITVEDIEASDLILTMTSQHKAFIKKMVQCNVDAKVFTLKEYIKEDDMDITDPYGGSLYVYKSCLEELYLYINRLADLLQ
jgi:protein-tyrosine phosphatase